MSTFRVPVVEFTLETHPNADSLSIANIKGWQCVVKTEDFLNEQYGVYVPIDSVASENHPLLSFLEGKKVKTIKLRKIISQGVLLPFTKVLNHLYEKHKDIFPTPGLGDDLSELLEINKCEPPVNSNLWGGKAQASFQASPTENFNKYTNIEHYKNFPNIFKENEHVIVTEKLHGTSARFFYDGEKISIGTRNTELKLENFIDSTGKLVEIPSTAWHSVYKSLDIESKLKQLFDRHKTEISLYGEIIGRGVQDLHYGFETPTFFAYDIKIGDRYLSQLEFHLEVANLQLNNVPVLFSGKFTNDVLNLRLGKDTISNSHVREGIVIEPFRPRFDPELGRVKVKVISEEYEQRNGATDFAG